MFDAATPGCRRGVLPTVEQCLVGSRYVRYHTCNSRQLGQIIMLLTRVTLWKYCTQKYNLEHCRNLQLHTITTDCVPAQKTACSERSPRAFGEVGETFPHSTVRCSMLFIPVLCEDRRLMKINSDTNGEFGFCGVLTTEQFTALRKRGKRPTDRPSGVPC